MEEADGSAVALVTEERQLEALMGGLNRRGMRERALLNALKRRQKLLAGSLTGGAPDIVPAALEQSDRCGYSSARSHEWLTIVLVLA